MPSSNTGGTNSGGNNRNDAIAVTTPTVADAGSNRRARAP